MPRKTAQNTEQSSEQNTESNEPKRLKPLVQPQPKDEKKRLTVNMSLSCVAELGLYAEFLLGSDQSYVVEVALKYLFEHDRAYLRWLADNKKSVEAATDKLRTEDASKLRPEDASKQKEPEAAAA